MPFATTRSDACGLRPAYVPTVCWMIPAVLVLCLTQAAQGQKQAPPPPIPEQFPEEHKPPSAAEMERMSRVNRTPIPQTSVSVVNDSCLLPPLNLAATSSISANQLQIGEKARAEYQKACGLLRKKKTEDAQKHFRKAVERTPKFAAAWVGLAQALGERMDEARQACLQASVVEPSYVPSYLCLADLAARSGNWDEVLKFSSRAIELLPADNVAGYEYQAAALLKLHDLAAAERSGLRAAAMDQNHREPRLHFVLAQIYEAKGDPVNEAMQLREYLLYATNAGDIALAKQNLAKLETQNLAVRSPDATPAPTSGWSPTVMDEPVRAVPNAASCPTAQILTRVSDRIQDFIDNFDRFSANERIEETETDNNGKKRHSNLEQVSYVAQITQNSSGYPTVNEYRDTRALVRRSAMVDSGIAASALIFHPSHIGNFTFTCEGLKQLRSVPAWQLRFEEGTDPNRAFTAIRVGHRVYLPRFKGRAWISEGSNEVLRIETDLVSPIREINLEIEHMEINYEPVEFLKHHERLWLPANTTVYLAYRGHRYERIHTFSQFQLFSVDTVDSIRVTKNPDEPQKLLDLGARESGFDLPGRTVQRN